MVNDKTITANAIVPDQLLPYVKAVADLESIVLENGILHKSQDQGVAVIYPQPDATSQEIIDSATEQALAVPNLKHLTVLAAMRPSQAPQDAATQTDTYWSLALPCPNPTGKTANMLRRAAQEVSVTASAAPDAWGDEHTLLVEQFCKGRKLDEGTIYLFGQLGNYIRGVPEAVLFSARSNETGQLLGLTIGDFSAFNTAFYMFAFRTANACPGTADLLLASLLQESEARGHSQVNLGLGINDGIEFFKQKWGASKFLNFVETSWDIKPKKSKSWFMRLFNS